MEEIINNDTQKTPQRRKWKDVTANERFTLWLYSKAKNTDPKSNKLSNESLALLMNHPEARNILPAIATKLYDDTIDPMFVQTLLCIKKKSNVLVTHSKAPYIHQNNKGQLSIKCDHIPHCQNVKSYPIHTVKEWYRHEQSMHTSIYHIWNWINHCSKTQELPPPLHVVVMQSGDFVSSHENKSVYSWQIGQKAQQDKILFREELTLEEVLMLKHMQATYTPLDCEKKFLSKPYAQEAIKRKKQAQAMPSKLRLIRKNSTTLNQTKPSREL